MFQLILAIWLGKLIQALTRTIKIGGGSAAPGLYALKIEPNLVAKLSRKIPQNIIITGTNGKTTTSRMLDHLVKHQNIKTLRNSTGSNLERGIASSLIRQTNIFGQIKNIDLGIWELDEAAFNKVVFQIKPQIMVFLNAFRDQLDRYGEVDSVVAKWRQVLEKVDWETQILINGSDNNTVTLNSVEKQKFSIFKVIGDKVFGEKNLKIDHDLIKGDFEAKIEKVKGLSGSEFTVKYPHGNLKINLPIPGVYHIYDFLAAFSAYYCLNLEIEQINSQLQDFSPAFGRVEKISLGKSDAYIFLIKNPAGATLVFETVNPELKKNDRLLLALNDNFADGTDVSWIWDAEFEQLTINNDHLTIICSGTRAYDLANRLKYAGVEPINIEVEPSLNKALNNSVSQLEGRLFILPTYTALLELQKILAARGHKAHYWNDEH